jgi:hypothetical protein
MDLISFIKHPSLTHASFSPLFINLVISVLIDSDEPGRNYSPQIKWSFCLLACRFHRGSFCFSLGINQPFGW